MKNYFAISEFAKLRDININSLRYYEKLGLLKPAFVDENRSRLTLTYHFDRLNEN